MFQSIGALLNGLSGETVFAEKVHERAGQDEVEECVDLTGQSGVSAACPRTDNHVHELFYDSHWHHNDLTLLATAPSAAPGSHIDGYQTEFNSQQHVNYIGADNHIHELFYINSWSHNDLTQLANAPAAAPASPVDGYQTSFNDQQHVNFLGTDNHVHELVYIDSWQHNNLTDL